jgi:hypothetical protein
VLRARPGLPAAVDVSTGLADSAEASESVLWIYLTCEVNCSNQTGSIKMCTDFSIQHSRIIIDDSSAENVLKLHSPLPRCTKNEAKMACHPKGRGFAEKTKENT